MMRFFRSNSISSFASIVGLGAILSGLLGLLRYRLLASGLGASRAFDIYVAAFRVPDFIYGLLILGSISATFIPLFTALQSREERNTFISAAFSIIGLGMLILCALLFISAPFFVTLIVPGFDSEAKRMTVLLTRIMLAQPVLLAISNLLTNTLQGFNKFVVSALAPSFYNIGIILGILLSVPHLIPGVQPIFGLEGLAYGVVAGSLLQLAVQLPAFLSLGLSWRPIFRVTSEIKKMFTLMGPRILGVASDQINVMVITAIASTLSLGSITIFSLAQNIQAAPMGIIGIAVATAAFPTLSRAFSHEKRDEFIGTFIQSFTLILFFTISLSLLFIMLRAQIVRVILGTGQFGWDETRLTAASLGIFGMSLFAQTLLPLVARAYYSMRDTKTPVIIGLIGFVVNVGLSFLFVHLLSYANPFSHGIAQSLKLQYIFDIRVIGLALAFSLTVIIEFLLLFLLLLLHIDAKRIGKLNASWLKIVVSAFTMALATYGALRPLATLLNTQTTLGVFLQGFLAGLFGIGVYLVVTHLLKENPLTGKH